MKVLLLTQVLPYPPDSGPKVKTWNLIKHLAVRDHRGTTRGACWQGRALILDGLALIDHSSSVLLDSTYQKIGG
jgi:hypothetical protein